MLAALCAMVALLAIPAFLLPSPTPDWPSFYAGAKLAPEGTARLYSFAASQAITGRFMSPVWVWAFVRPPMYATALYPLGLLTPRAAFVSWQILNLAAVICMVMLLWRSPTAVVATLSCAPMWTSFRQGQDMPLVLLAAAVSIALIERRRTYLAGIVLALCGIKFHLLLLIPIFLLIRKAWRVTAGVLTGATVLIGACFVQYGPSWMGDYYRCLVENQKHLKTTSLLSAVPAAWWAVAVCAVAVALTVVLAWRSTTEGMALAVAMAMGLTVAPRIYLYDVTIALPALLVLLRRFTDDTAAARLPHIPCISAGDMLHKSHTAVDKTTVESYI